MNRLRLLLRTIAWWILGNIKPSENDVDVAIRAAFHEVGLNEADYAPDFDLLRTGKVLEVVIHASRKLGNPIVTVQDVKELLQ